MSDKPSGKDEAFGTTKEAVAAGVVGGTLFGLVALATAPIVGAAALAAGSVAYFKSKKG